MLSPLSLHAGQLDSQDSVVREFMCLAAELVAGLVGSNVIYAGR